MARRGGVGTGAWLDITERVVFLDSALQRALRRTAATMAAILAAGAVAAVGAPAAAAATPGLTLGKTAPSSVLAGGDVAFSLTAGNPASNPGAVPEYNLGFADPLPAGLTYVAGSVSPTSAGEPTIVTDALTGRQTLVWRNVADLQVGDSLALSFRTHADATVLPVGATFTNTGSAYANTDPRRIPAFDATGAAVPGSFTESAAASAGPTTVSALDITKSEPSPEAELLRGVHDHTTVYTLTVTNTSVAASTGVVLTDYLPAALEFLGCGGVDNSSGPEYPGAPSLSATPLVSPCIAPVSVSTVSNPPPDGTTTYPAGVYTRVQWNLGSLAGGATQTIRYRAAIPLRANTTSFGGTTPTPASLGQSSNLDNNTGPSTRETATEASATNIARVSGTYSGPLAPGGSSAVSADTSHTVSIEDVRMRKAASTTQFATSGRVQYTVTIDTSEYTSASGIVVADVIPNGLCPLGGPGTNYTPGAPSECAGSGATAPSGPFSSVTPNADGTFTVTFAPLGPAPVNGTVTLSYWAGMRTNYAGGDPTVNGDSFVNQASLTATTTPRPGTGESGPQTVGDTSSATIGTGGITIDKTIGPRSMGGDCGTDGSGYGEPSSFPAAQTQFGKGDIICFKVRVDFDTLTKTRNPVVTDFLPVGTEYVAGSATATTHDSRSPATLTATADSLTWVVGTGGGPRFVDIGAVFEWVFAVRVTDAAPVGNPDILGNAMKLRTEDSAGRGRSYRDEVDFTIVPAAPLRVVKGVLSVDTPATGPNGLNSNVDGSSVREGSVVRFRIDLTNDGTAANETDHSVGGVDLWDVLPDGITCADISNIAPVGSIPVAPVVRCTDPGDPQQPSFALNASRSAIRWTYTLDTTKPLAPQSLDPGASWTFTYDMTIPPKTSAGFVFTNTAAVHQYSGLTNLPVSRPEAVVSFFPQSNIDTSLPVDQQDAAPASDTSWVTTPGAVVAKTGTTSITETNNDAATQATIGELVTYRYAVTVPAHTSVFDGALTDALPTGFVIAAPAPTAEFCPVAPTPGANPLPACAAPAALPAGVSLDATSGALTVAGAYDNTTASPQRFLVTLTARVTGAALDVASNAIDRVNTATFTSDDKLGGTPLAPVSATYTINVRQPNPVIVKSNNKPGTVSGGDTVTFTVLVGNRTSASDASARPPLHDTFVVDCVPAGLTFAAYGANPGLTPVAGDGTNGCATGTTRLVWSLGTIAPSVTLTTRTYTATVNLAAVGGDTYTNTAVLTGSTLDDGQASFDAPDNPDERTYSRTATSSVVVGGNTVTKSVDQPQRTIGQTATYTLTVTVPANTNFYDAAILDTVPAGLSAPALQSSACIDTTTSVACPGFTATALTSVAAPGGATKVGWYVGDLTASSHPRSITIVYTSVVQDVPANIAGKALANTVTSVWNATDGRTPTTAGDAFDRQGSSAVATVTVLEPTLAITKAVSDTTPDPAQQFQYTVTVRNGSGVNVSPAYNTVVTDVVPLGVVVDSIAGGGTLAGADPVRGGGTITWSAASLPGPLPAGASYTLTYLAHLAPSSTLTAAALTNTASIPHYEGLPSGGRTYTGPSTTARVTPQFPRLVTTKAATDGAPAYIGTSYAWTVTVTNSGGSAASAVSATDTLPAGWTYDAGTAQVRIAGGPATQVEPSVSTAGTVQTLTWTGLGTLAPTQALTIVYRATPQPSVVTAPGVGAAVAQTNTANSFGNDPSGASGNSSGPYGNHPGSAATHIDSADVRIAKTHTGSPVAGAPFTWSLAVSNAGPDRAVGPFTVSDTIQTPATLVSASGTGWSCTVTGQQLSCTRTNANDTLASGAAFPVISVVVSTAADLAGGTVLTNTATVSARTYDPVTGNNTSTDSATSTTSADLAVTKHHTGSVVAGQDATWTVDVVNHGPSVSVGPITVSDGLPAGVAFVSASGAGWSCTQASGTVTCIRNADLAVGAAAPQITIVGTIPAGQTAAVVNTAAVSGTTPDPDHTNDSSTDSVLPGTSADLAIAKTHVGSVVAGAPATYQVTVSNLGPSVSRGPITVTDTLPAGTTLVSATGTGWSCAPGASSVACVRAADLAVGATAPVITVVVAIPSSQTGQVLNTATVTGTTSDPNPGNNTDTDTSLPGTKADLVIDKSHTGTAVAGSDLTWTLDVSNAGPSDSPGDITVTDALPAGVAFVSASGSGWSCSVAAGVLTCTRSATLAAGASAPSITLVVTIDPSYGPAALANTASVDGPLTDPDPTNNSDTDTVTVVDKAEVRIAKSTTGADPVRAGESTEFTLTVTNDGPSTADTVVVDDTLPVGLTPTTVTAAGWSCTVTGRQVECTRGSLLPGSSTITVEAAVGSDVLDGTTLTNTATVSTATPGDDPTNNSASSTVHVVAAADLVLAKSHAPAFDTVAAGSDAVFRLDVRNDGPSDAQADITIVDTLPAGLSYVSSTGPWTCVAGPAAPSGQQVTCTLQGGALSAGATAARLSMDVHVDASTDAGDVTNRARVDSPTTDPVPGNNSSADTIRVTQVADLSVVKKHTAAAHIGDDLAFTLTVSNAGPSEARDVVLTDALPTGLTFESADGPGWTCGAVGAVVTCTLAAPLAPNASAADVTVVATVTADAYPSVTNTATVEGSTLDPDPSNNTSDDIVTVPPLSGLDIVKSHRGDLQVGSTATYTLAVTNHGPTADPGPITVTDPLPVGLDLVSATGQGWTCTSASRVVTCTLAGSLTASASTSIALVVRVMPAAYPGVTNVASVSTPTEQSPGWQQHSTDTGVVLPLVDLGIVKTLASYDRARSTAVWQIAVTNHGPNASTTPIVVTDPLPAGLGFESAGGTGWRCALTGRTVTCTRAGDLAVGASSAFTLTTMVTAARGSTVVNTATVVVSDRVPANNTSHASLVVPSDGGLSPTGADQQVLELALLLLLVGAGLLLLARRPARRD